MSIFDSLFGGAQQADNSQQDQTTGIGALSPQIQAINKLISQRGKQAFFNSLLQSGAPSPYKTSPLQLLAGGVAAANNATGGLNDELLKAKIGNLTPKYEVTKDAFGNPIAYNSLDPSQTKTIGGGGGIFGSQSGGGVAGDAMNPSGLSGEEFLKTLPPQIGTQVKAMAEGRMSFPGGMAMKTPYWQQMIQAVGQYDPNFDAVNYSGRNKTYQDFTSGKSRQNVNSIDTAINTLTQLQNANEKLGGTQYGNSARNFILNQMSDPNLVAYNNLAKTAADEVTKAVVGGVGGTGHDRQTRESTFTANQSPEARKAGIQSAIQELSARLDPLNAAYNQGMGTSKGGVDLLTPKTVAGFNQIMGQAPDDVNASGVKTLQNAQEPGAAAVKPTLPPAGAIKLLKANPGMAAAFEAKYGISSKTILGQ